MSAADAIRFAPRDDRSKVELGLEFAPKFDANGLLTAVAVDHASGEVLMVAHMNEEALRQTLALGEAVYWSRSRKQLWHKGKTSGHTQSIREILVDCDQDALVLRVDQAGPGCCHAGFRSCFSRRVDDTDAPVSRDSPVPLTRTQDRAFDPAKVYG